MQDDTMTVVERGYDLDERTQDFAVRVRQFLRKVMKTRPNIEDGKQLIRTSALVATHYIAASEAWSRKDYFLRIRHCRKEARESMLFLRLLDTFENKMQEIEKAALMREASELMKIFGAIVSGERQK